MPPSTLNLTPDLTKALRQIDQTGYEQSVEKLLRGGSSTVTLKDLIHYCLAELARSLPATRPSQSFESEKSRMQARRCLKMIRVALETVARRPRFDHSLGAQTGLKHLISDIERVFLDLEHDPSPEPAAAVAALLAREFQIAEVRPVNASSN